MIRSDGDSLKALLLSKPNFIYYLLILPMVGLYCRVAQEYYGVTIIDVETDKKINELRDSYKFLCDKFGKIKTKALEIDNQQTEYFQSRVKLKCLRRFALNLGVYFDEYGHIIGDTYLITRYFNSTNMKNAKENAYAIGDIIAEYIDTIRYMACKDDTMIIPSNNGMKRVGYIDINTNRHSDIFNKSQDKALNIIILNFLGLLGADKYLNQLMLSEDDTWRLRNEYIVAHNIRNGLRTIRNYCQSNNESTVDVDELTDIISKGTYYFSGDYRNCMMHYDLVYEGVPRIKEEYFDEDRVFYGLVESCFEGMDYIEYYTKLREYMSVVETFLNSWFDVKYSQIKWDL